MSLDDLLRRLRGSRPILRGKDWMIAEGYVWREDLFGWRRATLEEMPLIVMQARADVRVEMTRKDAA